MVKKNCYFVTKRLQTSNCFRYVLYIGGVQNVRFGNLLGGPSNFFAPKFLATKYYESRGKQQTNHNTTAVFGKPESSHCSRVQPMFILPSVNTSQKRGSDTDETNLDTCTHTHDEHEKDCNLFVCFFFRGFFPGADVRSGFLLW